METIQNSLCLTYKVSKINKVKRKKEKKQNLSNQLTIEDLLKINSKENNNIIIKYQKTKDRKLLDKIIEDNFKLINYCIEKYNLINSNIDYADMEQEGYLGLLKAIQNYIPNKGSKFSTYALIYIRAYLQNYIKINGNGSVSISSYGMNLLNKYKKDEKNIKDTQLKVSFRTISTVPIFLDAPITNSDDSNLFIDEIIGDSKEQGFSDAEFNMVWNKIAIDLTKKEKEIIQYYIQGWRWIDIAKKYKSSPSTIRCNAMRGFNKMKDKYGEEKLRELLCS